MFIFWQKKYFNYNLKTKKEIFFMKKSIFWKFNKHDINSYEINSINSLINLCYRLNDNLYFFEKTPTGEEKEIKIKYIYHDITIDYIDRKYNFSECIFKIPGINYDFEVCFLLFFKDKVSSFEYDIISNYLRTLLKWQSSKSRYAEDIIFEEYKTTLLTCLIPKDILNILNKILIENN